MDRQLTRKRRKRTIRKCGEFRRGKCAACEQPSGSGAECDMKKAKAGGPPGTT